MLSDQTFTVKPVLLMSWEFFTDSEDGPLNIERAFRFRNMDEKVFEVWDFFFLCMDRPTDFLRINQLDAIGVPITVLEYLNQTKSNASTHKRVMSLLRNAQGIYSPALCKKHRVVARNNYSSLDPDKIIEALTLSAYDISTDSLYKHLLS